MEPLERKTRRNAEHQGPTILSHWVIARRAVLDMSQGALAEKMNRSQPYVCNIENGHVWNMSVVDAVALADVLQEDPLIPLGLILKICRALKAIKWSDALPEEGSGSCVTVQDGDLKFTFVAPEAAGLTKPERATAGVGEFATKDTAAPKFRWPAVDEVPIHLSDIPDVEEGATVAPTNKPSPQWGD